MLNQIIRISRYTVTAALAMCLCWSPAGADEPIKFEIPAQPAAKGLNQYAEQASLQIMFPYAEVKGVETNEVVGEFDKNVALDTLLADTGLEVVYGKNDTATVRPIADETDTEGSRDSGNSQPTPVLTAQSQTSAAQSQSNQTSPTSSDEGEAPLEIEQIIVTGSRIRGAQSAAPVIAITAEDIDKAGFATVEQLVQSIPQNFGGGASQINNTLSFRVPLNLVNGAITGGEVSIDLRGLGSDSTLTLLNGRRLSGGGFQGGFVDVSSIPITAIERVEILTDGASAIYGADAIGGVVNFILRDDYDGAETRLRYGPDVGADYSDVRFGQLFGKSWGKNNVLLSYEYYHQENLSNSARRVTSDSDLRPLGGDNWSRVGGNPGTITAGGTTYAIPAGQDGAPGTLTPADFVAGTQNFRNFALQNELLPEQDRHSVLATFRREFSDTSEFFLEARYSKRKTTMLANPGGAPALLTVPDTNPYFVDPTGTGLTSVSINLYDFTRDIGHRINEGEIETHGGVTGFQFELGSEWQAEIAANYSNEESSQLVLNSANSAAVRAAAAGTTIETALNPFADGSNSHPDVLAAIASGGGETQDVEQDSLGVNLDLNGRLFSLSSGVVSLATGLEFRTESLKNQREDGPSFGQPLTLSPEADVDRRTASAYVELFLPLIGSKNVRSGAKRLEVSVAARYDHYDDFGSTTNPKFGVLWAPSDSVSFRGTIGTSFKPPLLTELFDGPSNFNVSFWFPAPIVPIGSIILNGGNSSLRPEEATTWTAGIQLAPEDSGFKVDLTYFDVDFTDRVEFALPSFSIADSFQPQYAAFVNLNPTPEEITAIVNSPNHRFFFGESAQDLIDGTAPVGAILDARRQNIARSEVSGLDLQIQYGVDTSAGQFDFGLNGSYLLDSDNTLLPGDMPISQLNVVSFPVDLRMRGSASWIGEGWGASAFVNYTDSYTNNQPHTNGGEQIDSWTTVDMQLSYNTESRFSSSLFNGTRLSLTIQNLLDEEPPFVNSDRGLAYDPVNANALGRLVAIEINKSW